MATHDYRIAEACERATPTTTEDDYEVTLWWDTNGDPEGPAFRIVTRDEDGNIADEETGPLDFAGWIGEDEHHHRYLPGYNVRAYFGGQDEQYQGPDRHGAYPLFTRRDEP